MSKKNFDPDTIRARRKLIRDDAACTGCGARMADCEAERGKDPTAPLWFGCCAQGAGMGPCSHRMDPGALNDLLREIEKGEVRLVEEILAERAERKSRRDAQRSAATSPDGTVLDTPSAMLGQGEWWRRRTGEWIRIADMSPGHRYNTAALVMRGAGQNAVMLAREMAGYAAGHDGGDMAQASLDQAAYDAQLLALTDPQRAIRESMLYRTLTAGLTIQGSGTEPWQKTGRDPVTGEPCSGEAHA